MRNLALITVCLLLASCGGGALVDNTPTVATPTYTEYVNFINNGGTVPDVQALIFTSYTETDFASFSSINVQYTVPDGNGNQSIVIADMGGSFNETVKLFEDDDTDYNLFSDNHLASVHSLQDQNDHFTIGFVDFGGQRTLEKTKYVTQLLHFRRMCCEDIFPLSLLYDTRRYNFYAFVMGDQTWSSDMPSSGSATYNGFTQMLFSQEDHSSGAVAKYYSNGTSTFTANFANRDITGQLAFEYLAWAKEAEIGRLTYEGNTNNELILDLNGTISGTSFSGTVTIPYLTYTGDITSSFTGNFYGPNATELGGIFNYSNENHPTDNPSGTGSLYAIGTFTGCQGC